ncbi:hypothetical protein [Croceicoccus gelatinilyticus]|uniref:hypothetical protein n=1 Tax=Croceicoccus gelatinilyticus TaxID=2835536 RepID=UPI001BCC69B3|nr:hypothetical protein [Croceicoccus gelatinilyticus]MBS7671520.1 hypothetical protein [Croceicoccus gelatinilyticus]
MFRSFFAAMALFLACACDQDIDSLIPERREAATVGAGRVEDEWKGTVMSFWRWEPFTSREGGPEVQATLVCNYRSKPLKSDQPHPMIILKSLEGDLPKGEFKLSDGKVHELYGHEGRYAEDIYFTLRETTLQIRFDDDTNSNPPVHTIDLTEEGPAAVLAECQAQFDKWSEQVF